MKSSIVRYLAGLLANVAFVLLACCGTTASGAVFTVTNTSDSGAGSLRQAITDANANVGPDTISFTISGAGTHSIQPATALPNISDPVIIDGYTQPGASMNTLTAGNNAVLKIELKGSFAGSGVDGLTLAAGSDGSTVKGLVINRFSGDGIIIFGNENNIAGNFIGTDISGSQAAANNGNAIVVDGNSNRIGGIAGGISNVIAFNGVDGVQIVSGQGNSIYQNSLFANFDMGIDLGFDGVSPNDLGDGDSGPNNRQNFPLITALQIASNGDLRVTYQVDSAPANAAYPLTIEFFRADAAGSGEGKTFIGRDSFASADFLNGFKTVTLGNAAALGVSDGVPIVATATDAAGNSSEFSAVFVNPLIRYVDRSAVNGTKTGTSWANAYTNLQNALTAAADSGAVVQLWVARGMYSPAPASGPRESTFLLKEHVALLGGFAGTETDVRQRNPKINITILSGDLNGDDPPAGGQAIGGKNAENSYHVVSIINVGTTVILDGFTIRGGNANGADGHGGGLYAVGASSTVANCIFTRNIAQAGGGGLANSGNSSLRIINSVFVDNVTHGRGGGIESVDSTSEIVNCVLVNNSALEGGGIGSFASSPAVLHCTIAGNFAFTGGGMFTVSGLPRIANSILWGNTAVLAGEEIDNDGADPIFSHCDIDGSGGSGNWDADLGVDGGGNLDSEPMFTDDSDPDGADNRFRTTDDGLRLRIGSPAIDGGGNDGAPPYDVNDVPRPQGAGFDLGAYEFVASASVGDFVWNDLDKDGIQDNGEPGIGGVAVSMVDPGVDGLPDTQDDHLIDRVTSAANGRFSFVELDPGRYFLKFVLPAGLVLTLSNQGAADAVDSDADPATGRTGLFLLAAGQIDLNWDAGGYFSTIRVNAVPEPIVVSEGASAELRLVLDSQPYNDVTVVTVWSGGDPDLRVQSGSVLTFTPENWHRLQTVTIQALEDDDDVDDGSAVFSILQSSGSNPIQTRDIIALENDNDDLPVAIVAVTSTQDSGPGSLRRALAEARPGDLVSIETAGVIALTSGELTIDKELVIVGPGAELLTISGENASRVFHFRGRTATLSGVTISDGVADRGGGVLHEGDGLTLMNCAIFSNRAALAGGGVWSDGSLTVTNCEIVDNDAVGNGGGLFFAGTTLSLTDTRISGNTSNGRGGGLWNSGALATAVDCILAGNRAGSDGGGIAHDGVRLIIRNSGLSGNDAAGGGGAVWNRGLATVTRSAFWENRAADGGGIHSGGGLTLSVSTLSGNRATGAGGGLLNDSSGVATLSSATIAENIAVAGGGIMNRNVTSIAVRIKGSIIANNVGSGDCSGDLASAGFNLDGDGSCGLAAAGDLPHTEPRLGSLQDNGGPTLTRALLPSSPAIDRGDPNDCADVFGNSVTTDQREFPRAIDGNNDGTIVCDLGAFEARGNQPPAVSITAPANGFTFIAPESIVIEAAAADADGDVVLVEFFQGNVKLGQATATPYRLTFPNAAAGVYSLTARARDNSGLVTTSDVVVVTGNPTAAPEARIISPEAGASFTAPWQFTIRADASDADGVVALVEFYRNGVKIGDDPSRPFELAHTATATGVFSFTARAVDNKGVSTLSAPIAIAVNPFAIQFSRPAANEAPIAPDDSYLFLWDMPVVQQRFSFDLYLHASPTVNLNSLLPVDRIQSGLDSGRHRLGYFHTVGFVLTETEILRVRYPVIHVRDAASPYNDRVYVSPQPLTITKGDEARVSLLQPRQGVAVEYGQSVTYEAAIAHSDGVLLAGFLVEARITVGMEGAVAGGAGFTETTTSGRIGPLSFTPAAAGNWQIEVRGPENLEQFVADVDRRDFTVRQSASFLELPSLEDLTFQEINKPLTVTGRLTPANGNPGNVALSGLQLQLVVIHPAGSQSSLDASTGKSVIDVPPTNAAGNFSYTLPANFFDAQGTWRLSIRFSGTENLAAIDSQIFEFVVREKAGYAVLLLGQLGEDGEGRKVHENTLSFVASALTDAGFLAEDILRVSAGGSGAPKQELATAIGVVSQRMKASPAPFYLVLVNHGANPVSGEGEFHVFPDEPLTPSELDTMLTALELELNSPSANPLARDEKIVVVLGMCYSGSFLPALSKPNTNRVIISAADADERSIREPGLTDAALDVSAQQGEYFVYLLFQQLRAGASLLRSFQRSQLTIEQITSHLSFAAAQGNDQFTGQSGQHPLLDDNQDGIGSTKISTSFGDGQVARRIFLTETDEGAFLEVARTTPSIVLPSGAGIQELWIELDAASGAIANVEELVARMEIREPGSARTEAIGSLQTALTFRSQAMFRDATVTDRIRFVWPDPASPQNPQNLFAATGAHDVFFYVARGADGVASIPTRTAVYRGSGAAPPAAFGLLAPEHGGVVDFDPADAQKVGLFRWQRSAAAGGGAVQYLFRLWRDAQRVRLALEAPPRTPAFFVLNPALTASLTPGDYWWDVVAVDGQGNAAVSDELFQVNLRPPNFLPGVIFGLIKNKNTGAELVNGTVTIPNAQQIIHDAGSYTCLAQPGTYSLQAQAPEFVQSPVVSVRLNAGGQVEHDFLLTPAASAPVTPKFLLTINSAYGEIERGPGEHPAGTDVVWKLKSPFAPSEAGQNGERFHAALFSDVVRMDQERTITVNWQPQSLLTIVSRDPDGNEIGNPKGQRFYDRDSLAAWEVTSPWVAIPNKKRFRATQSGEVFTITNPRTVNVAWTLQWYLDVRTNGGGGVDVASGWFDHGSQATLTAIDTQEFEFVQWTGDVEAGSRATVTTRTITLPINQSRRTTAVFRFRENVAPALGAIESHAVAYSENSGPQMLTSTLTLTDNDDVLIDGAVVSLVGSFHAGEDVLHFTDQGDISGRYDTGTGVLTLTGPASKANYQTALRSVTYENLSDIPSSPLARTARFVANDGKDDSNIVIREITIIAVNDPPIFTSEPVLLATMGTLYRYDVTTSDVEGNAITITALTLPGWLTLSSTVNGTATLSGTPGRPNIGKSRVTLRVADSEPGQLQDFEIVTAPAFTLDIDDDGRRDALTDGVLIVRYLSGVTGTSLTGQVVALGCRRCDANTITAYLNVPDNHVFLDVDGDSVVDLGTDGMLILRYLFGFRGEALRENLNLSGCSNCTAAEIEGTMRLLDR